jgi:dipeptidyl aminopeptidase/acylaminoacyl peptidase
MRLMFVGVAPSDYARAERSASPLFAVGPHTAPILIAHGAEDRMVSIKQSETLQDALTRDGVPNQLRVFHGGHEFAGAPDERRAYIDTALAFTKDPLGFLKTKRPPD